MGLSRFRSAVTLLPDFLNLVKHLRLNDRRVGVVEDSAVFCWILSLLLILLFHKNKTIFPARIAPDFVIGLGNTQSIPCARCLV